MRIPKVTQRRNLQLQQILEIICKEFKVSVLEAEEIYLSKYRVIANMFNSLDYKTMNRSHVFLSNNLGKFVVDYEKVKNYKIVTDLKHKRIQKYKDLKENHKEENEDI